MVNQKGLGILDLLIGITISMAVVVIGGQIFLQSRKDTVFAQEKYALAQDAFLIEKVLKKAIAFSQIRVFALNGSGNFDRAFSRFLFAENGVCADTTSSPKCADSTAMFFSVIDGSYMTSAKAFCWIAPGQSLLVDTDILPTIAGGVNVIALTDPPAASMWRVTGAPAAFSITASTPEDCFEHLDMSGGAYVTANRRVITVAPYAFPGSGSLPAVKTQVKMAVNFPLEVNRVKTYSAGLIPSTVTASGTFAVLECKLTASGFTCPTKLITAEGIKKVNVVQTFKLKFGTAPMTDKFQLVGSGVSLNSSICKSPFCRPLTVGALPAPFLASGENLTTLNDSGFSGLKQNFLARIDFFLFDDKGKKQIVNLYLD